MSIVTVKGFVALALILFAFAITTSEKVSNFGRASEVPSRSGHFQSGKMWGTNIRARLAKNLHNVCDGKML